MCQGWGGVAVMGDGYRRREHPTSRVWALTPTLRHSPNAATPSDFAHSNVYGYEVEPPQTEKEWREGQIFDRRDLLLNLATLQYTVA